MSGYEMVIGLEVHVELSTRTKAFCDCPNAYGAPPNTCVCPTCMGLPGALPSFNQEALRLSALAGLALGCTVHTHSRFDRKNYFYPDLPKAYQITQFYHPLCTGGSVDIPGKRVGITRIHMEEDAGKLTHEADGITLDMNRCGVPLIEIVTEPDLRTPEEAVAFLQQLRAILTCVGVSGCRMNEGQLRCDVNVSIRKAGEPFGTRTETKNLNSFQSVERAIRAEYARQVAAAEKGEAIPQQTMRFDQKTGLTSPMRQKEDSADYRYFPEPDLPWVVLTEAEIAALRASLPMLPAQRKHRFETVYGLSDFAARQLSAERWLAEYYETAAALTRDPVCLANLLLGEGFGQITLRDTQKTGERDASCLPIAPARLAKLSDMASGGHINSTTAKQLMALLFDADIDPEAYAREHDLFLLSDEGELGAIVKAVAEENPSLLMAYKGGKTNVSKALMGKAMAKAKGRADAEKLRRVLLAYLDA